MGDGSIINDFVISKRIPKDAIICGKVTHVVRISKKNKWKKKCIFELKFSYLDEKSIKVRILESVEQQVKSISEDVLKRCYYRNQAEFKDQWEKCFQTWDDGAKAWVVTFELLDDKKGKTGG